MTQRVMISVVPLENEGHRPEWGSYLFNLWEADLIANIESFCEDSGAGYHIEQIHHSDENSDHITVFIIEDEIG